MSKNFYISDLHFGHKNIIGFDSRPWNDLAEMEKGLINNWNNVVTKEDTTYIERIFYPLSFAFLFHFNDF